MSLFGFSGAMMNGVQGLLPQAPEPTRGRGFFGRGGTGRNIAGYIGDALMAQAGMQPIYGPQQEEQRKLAMMSAQMQAKRQADWEDFQRQEKFKRANPAPNDTERDYNFFESKMPGGGQRFIESQLNRPQMVDVTLPDGSVERRWISAQPQQQQQGQGGPSVGTIKNGYRFKGGNPNDRNSWEPVGQGGPSLGGSGGFRRY